MTMTYTQLGVIAVVLAVCLDLFVLRVRLLRRGLFWASYAIIVFFQLLTNGVLTGRRIVIYDPAATLSSGSVPLVGDWRLVYAPVEDLLFGFALIMLALDVWVRLGQRGLQQEPYADGLIQRLLDERRDRRRAASERA